METTLPTTRLLSGIVSKSVRAEAAQLETNTAGRVTLISNPDPYDRGGRFMIGFFLSRYATVADVAAVETFFEKHDR